MKTLWPHAHGSDVMIWMIHLAYRAEEVVRHRRDGCLGSVPGQIGDTNTKAERGAWHKKRESRIIYYLVRPWVVRVTFATFKRARIYILPSPFQRLSLFQLHHVGLIWLVYNFMKGKIWAETFCYIKIWSIFKERIHCVDLVHSYFSRICLQPVLIGWFEISPYQVNLTAWIS